MSVARDSPVLELQRLTGVHTCLGAQHRAWRREGLSALAGNTEGERDRKIEKEGRDSLLPTPLCKQRDIQNPAGTQGEHLTPPGAGRGAGGKQPATLSLKA